MSHPTATRPGRYEEILEVFTRKVAQNGYDGTNFSEIAAELGISKGTIVHHFGTKDRLLAALHEGYMMRRLAEARSIIDGLDSPPEQLAGLLYAFLIYQVHDRDATIAFQREIVRLADHPALAQGVRLRTEYLGLVRDVIGRGVVDGSLRDCEVNLQSLLVFGSAQWAWTWFEPGGRSSAADAGAALVDLVLGSLLTNRSSLADLADPGGTVVRVVFGCLKN